MHHRIPDQYRREAWKILTVSALTVVLGTFAVVIRHANRYPSGPAVTPEQNLQEQPAASARSSILYRTRDEHQWTLYAANTDNSAQEPIALLPLDSTGVYWIDESHLLYITDDQVSLRDITDQSDRVLAQAPVGHRISDGIVSSDRRWIAYRQIQTDDTVLATGQTGIFVTTIDGYSQPESIAGNVVPLFFDHSGHVYARRIQNGSRSPQLLRISFTENPPVITPFDGTNICESAPTISPRRDVVACIGDHPTTPSVSGIHLIDLVSGDRRFLLPPAVAGSGSDTTSTMSYTYTRVVWHDDGNKLAAQAVPSGDTTNARRVSVTIHPGEETITMLDPASVQPHLELYGYTDDGVVFGIPSGTAIGAFLMATPETTWTIPSGPAFFVTTLPGIIPLQ